MQSEPMGFRAQFTGFPALRGSHSLYQGERSVTSGRAGGAGPHRRTNMSLTIMTLSMINRIVVTVLRRRECAGIVPGWGEVFPA